MSSVLRSPRAAKRAFRWRYRLLLAGAALLLLLWFIPAIVARSPLRNWITQQVLAGVKGQVKVGAAALGWFSPVVLYDVEISDPDGHSVVVVPQIDSRKSLVSILLRTSDLGTFHCEQPTLQIVCSGQQSNLEQVFGGWLAASDPSTSLIGAGVGIEVANAKISILDADTKQQWLLDPVDLAVAVPGDRRLPTRIQLHSAVADGTQVSRLDADVTMSMVESARGKSANQGQLTVRTEGLPLSMLVPILRRIEPEAKLDGRLRCQLDCHWEGKDGNQATIRVDGLISASPVELAGPWLGEDRLRLERLELPCRLAVAGKQLRIEKADIACDLGKASLTGTLDTTQSFASVLTKPGYALSADIDLARLADRLPHALRLRQDTRITAGRLTVNLRCDAHADGLAWNGRVHTDGLAGLRQGQTLSWHEPVAINVAAHQAKDALPVFDQLQCDSGFLKLQASGSQDQWTVSADCDLNHLADQLARFVDLGSLRFAGQASAKISLQRSPDDRFRARADCRLQRFELASTNGRSWKESSLTISLEGTGQTGASGPCRIDQARLVMQGERDSADLQLAEPIADLAKGPWGAIQLRARGELGQWRGRLQPWLKILDHWQSAGPGELTARIRAGSGEIRFDDLRLGVREVRIEGVGLSVNEPALDVKAAGRWLHASNKLELAETQLTCATLALQSRNLQLALNQKGFLQLTGAASLQGDLARLWAWLQGVAPTAQQPLAGRFVGEAAFQPAGDQLVFQLDGALQQLIVGPSTGPAWHEPNVLLISRAQYDPTADKVQIPQFDAKGSAFQCNAQGSLTQLDGSKYLALAGQLHYDLEKLEPLLHPHLGSSVKLAGRDARPFHLEGALVAQAPGKGPTVTLGPSALTSPSLFSTGTGEAGMSWKSAELYGFQFGPAELQARLAKGWLQFKPIESAVNQGHFRLEPSVRLDPGPLELHLAKGTVIDRVHLTPAMCAHALGYALPVLAEATEVEGQISVASDGGRVPLMEPAKGDLSGRVTIHAVRVGPGPLIRELAILLKDPGTANLARESVVPVRLVDGRVYHRDLELVFPELTIRTHGSVGLDGTLAIMAEMPVPPKWLGHNRLGTALAKQTVRLPIGGTLHHPKLDEKALREASAHFLRDTAGELLRQEMNHQLERLLRPRQ